MVAACTRAREARRRHHHDNEPATTGAGASWGRLPRASVATASSPKYTSAANDSTSSAARPLDLLPPCLARPLLHPTGESPPLPEEEEQQQQREAAVGAAAAACGLGGGEGDEEERRTSRGEGEESRVGKAKGRGGIYASVAPRVW
uniref:Uncharacterized protein n=1 Tax=Oryza barthii TaxID=65489 RepID=A0A0D3GZX3_9ORYZ